MSTKKSTSIFRGIFLVSFKTFIPNWNWIEEQLTTVGQMPSTPSSQSYSSNVSNLGILLKVKSVNEIPKPPFICRSIALGLNQSPHQSSS